MASLQERVVAPVARVRRRRPAVDHVVRMQQHYTAVQGSQQAGGVTYYAFLSFFPVLALGFFVVGYVSAVFPDAQRDLTSAIQQLLPGLLGDRRDQIRISDIQDAAGTVGLLGLAGLLYSGLGWLSAMREALVVVFELPARDRPNFVFGKLRDLRTLAIVGIVLVLSVAVTGLVSGFSADLLDWLGVEAELSWLVRLVTVVFGLGANAVLFFTLFRLLAEPRTPQRSLWSGALLGAVGFEVLKQLSQVLLASTKGQPAFQAFGIALILLVWINYFSRVVLYAASWAHTSPAARAQRVADPPPPPQGPPSPPLAERAQDAPIGVRPAWLAGFAGGAAAALGLSALIRRRRGEA